MKLYKACIFAQKMGVGVVAAARILIAEDDYAAYVAALDQCKALFPREHGYAIHQADVDYLCDESNPITLDALGGNVYKVTLTKQEKQSR